MPNKFREKWKITQISISAILGTCKANCELHVHRIGPKFEYVGPTYVYYKGDALKRTTEYF